MNWIMSIMVKLDDIVGKECSIGELEPVMA